MSDSSLTAKSPEQIDAEFETVFAKIQPITKPKPLTLAQRLKPYRKAVLRQRRRGLTWGQIAKGMSESPIAFQVSEKVLRLTFDAKAAAAAPAKAKPESRPIRDPNSREVIAQVDRAGHVEPVPNSGPSPMTAAEAQRFQPLLDGLIPPIVVTKMTRRDARSYAGGAVELWKHDEAERFQQVLAAELDQLDETNCERYAVAPATIAPFKRKWNSAR